MKGVRDRERRTEPLWGLVDGEATPGEVIDGDFRRGNEGGHVAGGSAVADCLLQLCLLVVLDLLCFLMIVVVLVNMDVSASSTRS